MQGGRRFSEHTIDLPFMFDNVARAPHLTGPQTEQTKVMTEAMANAWLAFAHKGDPNHSGIPKWPTYDVASRPVMASDAPKNNPACSTGIRCASWKYVGAQRR